MKIISPVFAAVLMAVSMSVFAGEFKNECAWGLANDKHVMTDCSINSLGKDGKTYCFSSENAKSSFLKDPVVHAAKAKEAFGRS